MSEDGEREIGIATRWNERGFGFIRAQRDGSDIFCHCSAILDGNCLTNGAKVEFLRTVDERTGKHRAEKVTGGSQEEDAPHADNYSNGHYGNGSNGRESQRRGSSDAEPRRERRFQERMAARERISLSSVWTRSPSPSPRDERKRGNLGSNSDNKSDRRRDMETEVDEQDSELVDGHRGKLSKASVETEARRKAIKSLQGSASKEIEENRE